MPKPIKSLILSVFTLASFAAAVPALAYTPYLTASYQGSNSIQVTVSNANPNSQIDLYFMPQGSSAWQSTTNIGRTDYSGYFTQSISLGQNVNQIYVMVGGQQSSTVSVNAGGCTYNCGSPYGLSLSQNSLSLSVGQTSSITIYNNTSGYSSGNYYIASNSSSNVVSASVSGNTLNIYAYQNGSATIQVCQSGYSGNCASVYVTVSGSGNCGYYGCSVGGLTVTPSSLSLTVGQSATANVSVGSYYYSGGYYISSNSNSNVASASVSANTITVYGNQVGNTTIQVCQNSGSFSCASLYVTVSGGYGNITFSPSSVSLTVGQNSSVSVYNNSGYSSGNYYIASNSNSNVASASLSGSSLTVYALAAGNTNIQVCSNYYSGNCGTLYVTVTGSVLGANTNLWFSPGNPNMYTGQSLAVSINSSAYATTYPYYTNAYYISSNSNSAVVSASVSGTVLNLYAYQNGSSNITVCHSSLGFCGTLYVTVGGGYSGGGLSLSQTNLTVGVGQSSSVAIYGNGSYYVAGNSNQNVASVSVSGNSLVVYGNQLGNTTVSVCQSRYISGCATLYVTVSSYTYGGYPYNYNPGGGLQYPGSAGNVLGASVYPNGSLISENGTVYIVYKNTKTAFVSASAFLGFGFKFTNVSDVGDSGLADSGYVIRTSRASHPWGSWVKSGSTIYFVHETGLIPVPTWSTFLANGGQAGLVVAASSWDMSLPRLSVMTVDDSRLQ